MVDNKQIKQWLKDGTITQPQAKKMLADSARDESEGKSNKFIGVISTIGAVLIFVGFAWLIAKNWHQIPNIIKVLILVAATLGAFISGVMLRLKNHEGVGRSLITLGALLFILSLFLISQIYHLAASTQHYAWLLFIAWVIILVTAYLLDSPENLVVSMLIFFPWTVLQYISSASKAEEGMIFGFVLLFLSAGALLYGLSTLHNAIKHQFTNIYRFWTVLYFLIIFYILSFQSFLPLLSNYSFEAGAFPVFLILFIILCFFGFVVSILYATSRNASSLREVFRFLGILAVVFILILLTKVGEGASFSFWGRGGISTSLWLLWILNNLVFIGFIILMIGYGQSIGAPNIVGISIQAFILEILSRYIGFWMDLQGYFAFSMLAILGGVMLIVGAWQIPKWRRKLLENTKQPEGFNR